MSILRGALRPGRLVIVALIILQGGSSYGLLTELGPREGVIAKAMNPDPDVYPTVGVWLWSREVLFISVEFPNVPGARVDASVFEDMWGTLGQFTRIDLPANNQIQIRHPWINHPGLIHVLTVSAEAGAVEFRGHLEWGRTQRTEDIPDQLWVPNICYQLMYAPSFQAYPQEIPRNSPFHAKLFYEFVKRCFIFTEQGQTFLDNTERNEFASSVGCSLDDPRNNPPITQRYLGIGQAALPPEYKYVSSDRYVVPIMATVSKDRKYLIALAGEQPRYMQQALFECLHSYERWLPADAPVLHRSWRQKIYAMENRPETLRKRVVRDFPVHSVSGRKE